jgi:outer membrane lipoprotein-sorting protein
MYKRISLSFVLFLFALGHADAQDAREIIQKALDLQNGISNEGTMEMTLVRPRYERTITMKTWSLGSDYFMIYIQSPARDKGQVFLKRDTEMWNWVPSISRMIKLPPSMMGQNWMGSDMTNDDLVKMNSLVKDYDQSIVGEEEIEGLSCYAIELMPKPDANVVWGKIKLWVAKDEYFQLKGEYYDEDMDLINVMQASEITQFDDRKLPAKVVMTPVNKEGHQTVMRTKRMNFTVPVKESFFSQQNMKRVK